jgi:hypothetical protein
MRSGVEVVDGDTTVPQLGLEFFLVLAGQSDHVLGEGIANNLTEDQIQSERIVDPFSRIEDLESGFAFRNICG